MPTPDRVRIPYEPCEGDRFQYVGTFGDGKQFMAFVTGAFPGSVHYPDPDSEACRNKQWLAV
jgi:hypothetical protein